MHILIIHLSPNIYILNLTLTAINTNIQEIKESQYSFKELIELIHPSKSVCFLLFNGLILPIGPVINDHLKKQLNRSLLQMLGSRKVKDFLTFI